MNIMSLFKTILPATAIAVALTACAATEVSRISSYDDMAGQSLGERCRTLQARIKARAEYGMSAPSTAADYDSYATLRCDTLPASSTDPNGSEAAPNPSRMARTEIPLQRSAGGSYYLPVTVNQTLSVPFALDTGSEPVQIPLDVYLVLTRNGTISPSDKRGSGTIITADGSSHEKPFFIIHELKVGDRVVTDVLGTVSSPNTDPLLGQSFLARLGSYTIDNRRHVLTLG